MFDWDGINQQHGPNLLDGLNQLIFQNQPHGHQTLVNHLHGVEKRNDFSNCNINQSK